jgi:hypothetical protein
LRFGGSLFGWGRFRGRFRRRFRERLPRGSGFSLLNGAVELLLHRFVALLDVEVEGSALHMVPDDDDQETDEDQQ